MDDQHIALLVLSTVCALLGMLVGWMGGVAEGRARNRAANDVLIDDEEKDRQAVEEWALHEHKPLPDGVREGS